MSSHGVFKHFENFTSVETIIINLDLKWTHVNVNVLPDILKTDKNSNLFN